MIIKNKIFLEYMTELKNLEKDRIFCLHDIEHLLNVARIMQLINLEENKNIDKELIYASALLHDIGRVIQYKYGKNHAKASVDIAKTILDECGYNNNEINVICDAIEKHNSESTSELAKLLKYADKKSRNCYLCLARNECYWSESKKNDTILI